MSYHSSTSQASIDELFEEPAKHPIGLGWDKPKDRIKWRYYQINYRKRTNSEAARRYGKSAKAKACQARWRAKQRAQKIRINTFSA
jgi:hypothetical protein